MFETAFNNMGQSMAYVQTDFVHSAGASQYFKKRFSQNKEPN